MKNNFLYLNVRETMKVGELVISKKDNAAMLLRNPNYTPPKYGGDVTTFGKGTLQSFIYGIGWCKVNNVIELKGLEDFTFEELMKLWDEYGSDVVFKMFHLNVADCCTRKHIKALQAFRKNGIKDFEKCSKIHDMTLEMNEVLKVRWNLEMRGSPIQHFDTRYSLFNGTDYLGAVSSIMLFHHMFGDSSIVSYFLPSSISLDVLQYDSDLTQFCKLLWDRGFLKVDGFTKGEDGYINMPEEYSTKKMIDWIYGDGWGSKVEQVFYGDKLKGN